MDEGRKNIEIIIRLEAKDSQIENVSIISLIIEIIDPMEEIIFHDRYMSG